MRIENNRNESFVYKAEQTKEVIMPEISANEAISYELIFNQCDKDIYLWLGLVFTDIPNKVSYDDVFVALEDMTTFSKLMGQETSIFFKGYNSLWFTFDRPSTITLKTADSSTTIAVEKDYRLQIDPSYYKNNADIIFSTPPISVLAN
jgi:hypothetical protein